jgi:molybdate transport system substrate-binding protein
MRALRLLILLAATLGVAPAASAAERPAERLTVFAAASLTDVLAEIGAAYRERHDVELRFSFAASSTLARQIEAGAPADLAALASPAWAAYLAERGLILPETGISPAGNRLVMIVPAASAATLSSPPTAAEVAAILGPRGRLAIGDPAHVPAGIYAREALESLHLWPAVASRLAPADNARSTLALVARGEAPLGVVYATDAAISPEVRVAAALPAESHAPIRYPFAATADGNQTAARAFLDFVSGPEARAVFARFGFSPCPAEH